MKSTATGCTVVIAAALLASACQSESHELTDGGGQAGSSGRDSGSAGDGGSGCPDEIPTICRVCADGSCGEPVCVRGRWEFACPAEDGGTTPDGGATCDSDDDCPGVGACPRCPDGQSCAELTCLNGTCQLTCPAGELRWYTTCGDPVCGISDDPYDDPSIPNCMSEQHGDACTEQDAQCDGVASCGATLLCTDSDPTMQPGGCPISRARFKQDIEYLTGEQLRSYHEQLMQVQLASWHYRTAPEADPQLGFIIEDVEPSAAVSGDRVNMYGYLSMAVAAIQVQQRQILALESELHTLRVELAASSAAPMCEP
jgi:hypothetical protein